MDDSASDVTRSQSYSPWSISFPKIRKEHERKVVNIVPCLPTATVHADDKNSNVSICGVCKVNESRYTCPKCEVQYCSLECYRAHDHGKGSCTETFYQDRVSKVMNLKIQEHKKHTQRMIQNVYQEQQQQTDDIFPENCNTMTESISQDDLIRILQATESCQTVEELQSLVSSLSPQIHQSLERAIQSGQVQQWVLEPWYPWWRSDLAPAEEVSDKEDDDDDDDDETLPNKTLDERILEEITPFNKLTSRNGSELPIPDLWFHLVDIIYAVVFTLNLYHGSNNACCPENCVEAGGSLIQSSPVLSSKDARYVHLEQVLMTVVCAANAGVGESTTSLLQDVATICANFRLVARALLEGLDILKSAIQQLKGGNYRNEKATKNKLKLASKKMEFFLSWANYQNQQGNDESFLTFAGLGQSIHAWIADWDLINDDIAVAQKNGFFDIHSKIVRPLIEEISGDADADADD